MPLTPKGVVRFLQVVTLSVSILALLTLLPSESRAQEEADLAVDGDDVLLSSLEVREGDRVTIYALIHNYGDDLGSARVEFFDVTWTSLAPIGSDQIVVPSEGASVASVEWMAESGDREIMVRVTDVVPNDPDFSNNEALATFRVYQWNESIIFSDPTLLVEDANISIEYSTERIIPVQIKCLGGKVSNVTVRLVDSSGLEISPISPLANMSAGDVETLYLTLRAPPSDGQDDYEVRIVLIEPEAGGAQANVARLEVTIHPPVEEVSWWSTSLAATAVAGGVFGAAFAAISGTELGRYKFLCFVLPLYTKLKKEEVLDHYVRGKIHGYILANPGDHYSSIRVALDLTNSSLAYHLQVLEKEELIKSKRDGIYKRFYPRGAKLPDDGGSPFSPIQKRIIQVIRETPGVCQKDIASVLGVSSSTINYHTAKLLGNGLIVTRRRGMRTAYYLAKRNPNQSSND